MISFIKQLFGSGTTVNLAELIKNGATIIDVRSKSEFDSGHIEGSLNIPLDILKNNLFRFKKDKVIITCCASGMRSASAKNILTSNGFQEVYNGGGWRGLQNKIK